MTSLDKDISSYLTLLLNDLFKIYRKNKLKGYFRKIQNYFPEPKSDSSRQLSHKESLNKSKNASLIMKNVKTIKHLPFQPSLLMVQPITLT